MPHYAKCDVISGQNNNNANIEWQSNEPPSW